jgi:hypothetical protein
MGRATRRFLLALNLVCLAAALGGCDGCRRDKSAPLSGGLTFEKLADTLGLSRGAPLLTRFDVERSEGGVLLVHGAADLPDGTRLRVAIKRPDESFASSMSEMTVKDRRFDSPPMVGDSGPLPFSTWRFEISALFTPTSQPTAVLLATDEGKALRGPGITRTRLGGAEFFLVQEMKR